MAIGSSQILCCSLGCHLQAALEQRKQALQQAVRLNFAVDDDLLGLVVGAKVLSLALYIFVASARQLPAFPALPCNIVSATSRSSVLAALPDVCCLHCSIYQGANLARARRLAGIMSVEIEGHQVCVIAETQGDAEAARDVLEYMRQSVPIEPRNRPLLIGRAGKNIRDIQAKCGLHSINLSDSDVELVGLVSILLPCLVAAAPLPPRLRAARALTFRRWTRLCMILLPRGHAGMTRSVRHNCGCASTAALMVRDDDCKFRKSQGNPHGQACHRPRDPLHVGAKDARTGAHL